MSMPTLALLAPSLALLLAPGSPGTASGTVTDANSRPVPGAELVLAETVLPQGTRPEVFDRGRSDEAGRFRLRLPGEPAERYGARKLLALWAHRPGLRVACRIVPRDWPADGEPLQLVLRPPDKLALRVLGPDDTPVTGARVTAARVLDRPLPAVVADAVAGFTDRDGRADLTAFAPDELDVVEVSAPAFGTQRLALPRPDTGGVRTLRLAAVGRLEGRVTADDPRAVRGLVIHARTWADPSDAPVTWWFRVDEDPGVGGFAEAVTDAEGRFAIPALAEGTLTLTFVPHQGLPYRGRFPARPDLGAGKTTRMEVPLARAVRMQGVVREQGTGKPIPNAAVMVDWSAEAPRVRTDAAGRYSAYVVGQSVTPHIPALPRGYYFAASVLPSLPLPAGAAEVAAKPFVLARGATLTGRVLDEHGRPLPAAAVAADWDLPEGDTEAASGWTDRHGRFVLEGVARRADLRLTATCRGATIARPMTVRADSAQPITLSLSTAHAVAAGGRVVDACGQPLAGAIVRIHSGERDKAGRMMNEAAVRFEDRDRLTSDVAGRFMTRRWLRPDLLYRAEVQAAGFMPARTEWLEPAVGKTLTFPDVALVPAPETCTVNGRVVDQQGQPVPGAVVYQSGDGPRRTRATADQDGRFHLPGVYKGQAFLFVEREGFRFRGYPVDVKTHPVSLTLVRTSEPSGEPLHTLPPLLPRTEERALARRVLEPLVKDFTGGEPSRALMELLDIAPRVDPLRALALADRGVFPRAEYSDYLRSVVASGLVEESIDEALAVAETIHDPALRAHAYIEAADQLSPGERSRKQALLDTALLYTRAAPEPVRRLDGLGQLALRWIELGDIQRGTQLLREGQTYVAGAPVPNAWNQRADGVHARGRFAAKLARIDSKPALELALGYRDPYHDWYVGGVALGLAEHAPAEAERVHQLIHQDWRHNQRTARLCGRMAAGDRARARALADRLPDPELRLAAYGAMARTLAKSDRPAAAALLDELFAAYAKRADETSGLAGNFYADCVQAAGLLVVAEQLDADLLERCFWHALALRSPRPSRGDPTGNYESLIARLAIVLASYDRTTARTVLEPAISRMQTLAQDDRPGAARPLFAAATMIDPAWAVALLDALPEPAATAPVRPKDAARRYIADALARSPRERREYVASRYANVQQDSRDEER
jgi:protocatechuate 3,4-dioxygenase beta subunit